MLGSTFIEAAIGLSLIFLLMSLMCSVLCEIIARWYELRAEYLSKAVEGLVSSPGLAKLIYGHPLIRALGRTDWRGSWRKPSYLPPSLFARVVVELSGSRQPVPPSLPPMAEPGADEVSAYAPLPKASTEASVTVNADIESLKYEAVLADLRAVRRSLMPTPDALKPGAEIALIAGWFDAAMERVSGTYKRRTQMTVFLLAVVLTVGLNVDTLIVGNRLQRDKSLRDMAVASATSFATEREDLGAFGPVEPKLNDAAAAMSSDSQGRLHGLEVQLAQLNLPIGWPTGVELQAAKEKAESADQALEEAREYALVPAAQWSTAREDVRKKSYAVLAALASSTDERAIAELVGTHNAAKTAAAAVKSEDEKARRAVAEASIASEHQKLSLSELRARRLALKSLPLRAALYIVALRLTGWLLTAFAVSLGTRFWFDTLNKLVSIRSGVKPKDSEARAA